MTSLFRRGTMLGSLVLLGVTACRQQQSTETEPTVPGGTPTEHGLVEVGLECDPSADAQRGKTFDATRRLSRDELALTLRDLIGDTLYDSAEVAPRVGGLPSDEVLVAGDFSLSPPVGLAGVLSQIGQYVAEVASTDVDWRRDYVHPCAEALPITESCLANVIDEYGARVWRRPLTTDEVDDYTAFVAEYGNGERAFGLLLQRLLMGPPMVFHLEDGTGESDNGRLRLTDYEVASRISYLTTGGPPDDALYDAVERGDLATAEGVRAEVERLMDREDSRARVNDFFRYYTHLVPGSDPSDGLAAYNGIDPTGLGQAIYDEAFTWFDSLVYEGGTYADLMTSTEAHPPTVEAAALFGASETGPVEAPDHPGLLHRPALLASYGDRTSPIIRGAHLRKLFLCGDLGLPDAKAVQAAQEELGDISMMSNREATDALTSAGACIGCHNLINPLGYLFEGYDQMGVVRSTETVFDDDGNVTATFPLDTSIDNLFLGSVPVGADDSSELVGLLAHSIQARQCLSRRLSEYYHRSTMEDDLDTCLIVDIDDDARDATLRDAIVTAIANPDVFWKEDPR